MCSTIVTFQASHCLQFIDWNVSFCCLWCKNKFSLHCYLFCECIVRVLKGFQCATLQPNKINFRSGKIRNQVSKTRKFILVRKASVSARISGSFFYQVILQLLCFFTNNMPASENAVTIKVSSLSKSEAIFPLLQSSMVFV